MLSIDKVVDKRNAIALHKNSNAYETAVTMIAIRTIQNRIMALHNQTNETDTITMYSQVHLSL